MSKVPVTRFHLCFEQSTIDNTKMYVSQCSQAFMLSQSPAQVPVKYVSVQCKGALSRYSTI